MAKLIEITGKALSGEWGSDDTVGNGIPVLRTTNFTNDGIVDYQNVVTRIINKKNIEEKYLRNGDVIIEKSGGSDKQPVGRVVYFNGEENTFLFNNFTGVLRVKDDSKWYSRYVFYSLFSNYRNGGTRRFENKTTGLHNLKIDDYVSSFEIIELPMYEQKDICRKLDKIQEIIALRKKQLIELDMFIKARFVEMFGDITVNNKGLLCKSMVDICEIIDGDRGKNYPKQEDFFSQEYCLFLNTKNVTISGFNFDECSFITKEKDESLRKGKLRRGDIVLTTRGTIGNLAFYDELVPYDNVRINSGMVILRMNRTMIAEIFFIEQFKMLLQEIKREIASGSAQPQLPISTMKNIKLVIPELKEQEAFSAFVKQISKSKLSVQKSLEKLETLNKALMQKYFG